MNARIESETDRRITTVVTDNGGNSHHLTIDRTGSVESHRCDALPTEDSRSGDDRQRTRRSVRFGKYYVYRRRGYETLDPYGDDRLTYPERLAATTLAIGAMSPDTVGTQFERLYRGFGDGPAEPSLPADPPATAPNASWTHLEQDVVLDVGDERLRPLLDALVELEALGGLRRRMDRYPERRGTDGLRARIERLFATKGATGAANHRDKAGAWAGVAASGPLGVRWEGGETTTVGDGERRGSSEAGALGARIQLPASRRPARSPAALQRRLFDHLRCQLRDCYVGMGLAPPRDLRVRGPGIDWFTTRYERGERYQRYHDPDAIIDWTALSPIPTL